MSLTFKLAGLGLLFLFMLFSGIWLTRTGMPYSPVLYNVHKLLSLAAVIAAGIWAYILYRNTGGTNLQLAMMIAAGILFLILLITGGLLNQDLPYHNTLQTVHRILPIIAIAVTAFLYYLLLKNNP